MKKTLLTFAIIFISISSFSQEISFSFGPCFGIPFYYQFVSGGASKTPKIGFNFAADYIALNNKKVSWGVGIGFQNSRVELTPPFYGDNEERVSHTEKSNILYFNYKMVFRKRSTSFLSLDPLIGIQLNKTTPSSFDNQTGIGVAFSYVKKINLNETIFLKLEPKLNVFNIIPFVVTDMPERLTSIVINIGVGYKK
ncbi:MAG: hypothetical protein HQ522_05290 [Bacteroidetes bacterium]|nr:hypothetical protein [Bacteroidota bacterium]